MIPSESQLSLLRTRPHSTKLWLSIYQPSTVLACQVNDAAIAKGEIEIPYDNVTQGSYTNVRSGMTMRVGTTPGGREKGTIRVRSASSSIIKVAENSHINWADNDYLTIENFFEIYAVFHRIIQDPTDETKTIWYMDYDIPYTNQNDVLGTFICMGGHYAGFKDAQVYYTASGTYNVMGESLLYFWNFEGGTPSSSTSHTPGFVTYNTPGHYTTTLVVSGTSSGASDISYRHISIYDRPNSGNNLPILQWEVNDIYGNREQGGYTASIRVYQILPEAVLREGSLIVIFADDWYGGTKTSIGGNTPNRDSIVFAGYVLNNTIRYNYRDSYMEFEVGSPTEVMKRTEGPAIFVQDHHDPGSAPENPDFPSSWVAVKNMNLRRAIYHYFRWHSTVLSCCDFELLGTDRPLQYFDADRTSVFSAVDTLLRGAFVGKLCCDRQGKLWAERDIYIEPGIAQTSFTIQKSDWMEEPSIEEGVRDPVSYVEVGGVAYTGSTGTFTALMSVAPGTTPSYRGSLLQIQGLALISQDELNRISGNIWANRNAKYPRVEMRMAGNYRNYDIAPQEKIPLWIQPSDTVRGIVFDPKYFFIEGIRWTYDSQNEFLSPSLSLYELTSGTDGDAVEIPSIPPAEDGFNQPGLVFPKVEIPPFPTVTIPAGVAGLINYVPVSDYNNNGTWSEPVQAHVVMSPGKSYEIYGSFMIPFGYSEPINVYAIMGEISPTKQATAWAEIVLSRMDSDDATEINPPDYITLTNSDCPYGKNLVLQLVIPAGWGGAHVWLEYSFWSITETYLTFWGWHLT